AKARVALRHCTSDPNDHRFVRNYATISQNVISSGSASRPLVRSSNAAQCGTKYQGEERGERGTERRREGDREEERGGERERRGCPQTRVYRGVSPLPLA